VTFNGGGGGGDLRNEAVPDQCAAPIDVERRLASTVSTAATEEVTR
jgi:hypothetical protein